jgi:hypothetical protein
MRKVLLLSIPLLATACGIGDDGPTPYDDDYGVTPGNINKGAPDNNSLPDDNKADAIYPAKFELPKNEQSVVKSQGSRGVCSIFAATAVVENLFLKAGMPAAEVDFSEQYMQWSVKVQGGAFPDSEGSNVDDNLQAVVNYGDIKEAAWPYEPFEWSTANDPACTGGEENLPTKCFTHGDPPQMALDAPKFKLPGSHWINTNSIKAHLTANKTGVGVGMTFFYQSWNHRLSTIPVDSALWRKGIVTYPNDKDKTESAKQRAGHAIEIIGWDDDMEVPMRDADGKPVLDANGQPMKEKGFWLFKNSWGTASFGVEHPYGPGYGWLSMRYVKEYGSAVGGDAPTLDNNNLPPPPSGGTAHSYSAMPSVAIPDNTPAGVTSAIEVTDAGTLGDVKVTTDITHTYRGDLKVTLTHGATSVTVFAGEGGSADDLKQTFSVSGFSGELKGTWTLTVVDTAAQDTGTLNSWKLDVTTN